MLECMVDAVMLILRMAQNVEQFVLVHYVLLPYVAYVCVLNKAQELMLI